MLTSTVKKKKPILYGSYALILFIVYLIQYSGIISSPLGKPSVIFVLPVVFTCAILFKEWVGAFFGLVLGIGMDIVTNGSFFFNSVALFVICCAVGLVISRVFLNNTISAILLLALGTFAYFISKWLFLCLFLGNSEPFLYLWKITLPSAFFTTLVGLPIFFVLRHIARRMVK